MRPPKDWRERLAFLLVFCSPIIDSLIRTDLPIAALLATLLVVSYGFDSRRSPDRRSVVAWLWVGVVALSPLIAFWDDAGATISGALVLAVAVGWFLPSSCRPTMANLMVGLSLLVLGFAAFIEPAESSSGRAMLLGLSPISAGRVGGLLLVGALAGGYPTAWRSILCAVGIAWMAASGSAGPVLGAALVAVIMLLRNPSIKRTVSGLVLVVVACSAWLVVGSRLSSRGAMLLAETEVGLGPRGAIWKKAAEEILANPMGHGWGNFVRPVAADGGAYPHNFVLEVGHAGGWIAMLVVVVALVQLIKNTPTRRSDSLFAFLTLYLVVQAMLSFSVPGNLGAVAMCAALLNKGTSGPAIARRRRDGVPGSRRRRAPRQPSPSPVLSARQ